MHATEAPTELALLKEMVALLKQENSLLRQKIDALVRRMFGSSSERIDPAQLELLLQLASAEAAPAKEPEYKTTAKAEVPARPRKERSPRIPENLPVVEQVIEPEEALAAPDQWRCIGQEVSEQLDYEPARFLRRRIVRRKYVHTSAPDRSPIIAPLPEKLVERGVAGPGLLAAILVNKYCDHLPLYRQEQIFDQRHKVNLPRQTLARWVELCADWLRPLYDQIRTGVMSGGYVQIDETPVDYLAPGNGTTKQGYLWTACKPGGDVCYQWETSRAAECLERFVPDQFKGIIQCDGYSAYKAFAERRRGIELAGCWAHVRRKFHEAIKEAPGRVAWVLRQIQHLYRVESHCREMKAAKSLRLWYRQHQSAAIVERLRKAFLAFKSSRKHLPQNNFGTAVEYALSHWPMLAVFLKNGEVEIDNNLVENAIRPTAVGKKNWLFVGEAGAGQRGAIIYTLIESCRRKGINPEAYLRDVLTRLPLITTSQIPELLPQSWKKCREASRPLCKLKQTSKTTSV